VADQVVAVLGVGLVDPAAPVVHSDDVGLTRGDGCFEGCRVLDGAIDKLGAHLARMRRSAAALDIDFDEDAWQALVAQATAAWQAPGEASMRWFLTRGRPGAAPTGIVTIGPIPAAYAAQRRDGIRAITLPAGSGRTPSTARRGCSAASRRSPTPSTWRRNARPPAAAPTT
jgi:4-amino-4-deoxychorismate lyase